jgi:hypothetical protein
MRKSADGVVPRTACNRSVKTSPCRAVQKKLVGFLWVSSTGWKRSVRVPVLTTPGVPDQCRVSNDIDQGFQSLSPEDRKPAKETVSMYQNLPLHSVLDISKHSASCKTSTNTEESICICVHLQCLKGNSGSYTAVAVPVGEVMLQSLVHCDITRSWTHHSADSRACSLPGSSPDYHPRYHPRHFTAVMCVCLPGFYFAKYVVSTFSLAVLGRMQSLRNLFNPTPSTQ